MKVLIILNDPPYGNERSYNGLRLATALAKREGVGLRVFLMGDAVGAALADQKTPDGYYNLARMVKGLVGRHAELGLCGTCLDARGLSSAEFVAGVERSSMEELARWVVWADEVLTF
ncbi:MAG: DsrE family protein [Solirubrobacterales bacterium]